MNISVYILEQQYNYTTNFHHKKVKLEIGDYSKMNEAKEEKKQ